MSTVGAQQGGRVRYPEHCVRLVNRPNRYQAGVRLLHLSEVWPATVADNEDAVNIYESVGQRGGWGSGLFFVISTRSDAMMTPLLSLRRRVVSHPKLLN